MQKPSKHHRIAKSIGGSNHYDNILRWNQRDHNAYHILFGNNPFQIVVAQIMDIHGKAISPVVKPDIMNYLQNFELGELYNPKAVNLHKMQIHIKKNKRKFNKIIGINNE